VAVSFTPVHKTAGVQERLAQTKTHNKYR